MPENQVEDDKSKDAKTAAAEGKAAKEQAEQGEKDIETFLSAWRGEQLVRDPSGSIDIPAFVADREAKRKAADKD